MKKILVKKRSGFLEDFDVNKVKKALVNAGCHPEDTDKIAQHIQEWAEKQPGSLINSLEIEKQVITHTKEQHKDVLISFLIYAKNKIKPIKRVFNKRDIAQMLTSLFVIIQVYTQGSTDVPFKQAMLVMVTSLVTCGIILRLIEGKQMWKHLVSGFFLVSALSVITGMSLEVAKPQIIIAISVGLPVAAMVDVLGTKE